MNHKHILDLTNRLSQALDQNYDVVNMDAVMAVISSLEGTPITKEQLEATRLAKYVNQMRRRTGSKHLARRAKSLLKKWGEMVGIQQANEPTNSNVSAVMTGGDNFIASTTTTINSQHHRSQPTSPIAGGSIQLESSNDVINSRINANATDFLRSTVSNPAVSFLTRSANLNVHNSNNRLENAERQSEAACVSTVPTIDNEKPHTSFANLITGFCNDNSSISSNTKITTAAAVAGQHNITPPRAVRKSNIAKPTETYIIDQSSNSNSELSGMPSSRASIAPIVIDIQDSNSGSNLIASASSVSSTKVTPAGASTKLILPVEMSPATSYKPKKPKRDRKRKERETNELTPLYRDNMPKVVSDETSLNPQHKKTNSDLARFMPLMEDKSRTTYPISNISEILSLSNSSVSSMFPGDGATRIMEQQNRSNVVNNRNTLSSSSDLTFAGKFKQQQSNSSTLVPSILINSDLPGFNGSETTNRIDLTNASSKVAIAGQIIAPNKFIPFSGGGCNSNDSTSNSRASQFEVIDVVSQDNNQSKIIDELRLQKKNDATANIFSMQQTATTDNFLSTKTTLLLNLPQPVDYTQTAATSTIPEKKTPKKRGRKKGSKGVDSVIATETSLSSQMLITSLGSGCKKVKTTKELYAEMQNRKLGISTATSSPKLTNWPQQQLSSRPESSCSEPSLHSPRTLDACSTNATISTVATRSTPDKFLTNTHADGTDSDTITSEPSRDSIAAQNLKRGISIESNSNSQMLASKPSESNKQLVAAATTATTVEKQLRVLLKQLPSVPDLRNIELGCSADIIPCTCKITEILPEVSNNTKIEDIEFGDGKPNSFLSTDKASDNKSDQPTEVISINVVREIPKISIVSEKIEPHPAAKKPKKSIFDLDFDEDEDPLHTLKAENAAALDASSATSETNLVVPQPCAIFVEQKNTLKSIEQVEPMLQLPVPQPAPAAPCESTEVLPIFPTYQVDEDPECAAKKRFELQPQEICKFHINALHNCYIANVNGNWDNADTPKALINFLENYDSSEADGFHTSVVPKYGSLISERIKKDLMHVNFTKNFKLKNKLIAEEKSQPIMPFLGVSWRFQQLNRNAEYKHKKFTTHKLKNLPENKYVNTSKDRNPVIVKCETAASNLITNKTSTFLSNNLPNEISSANILGHKIILQDITIDIAEQQSSVEALKNIDISIEEDADVAPISQNLLAIAENMNLRNNVFATNFPDVAFLQNNLSSAASCENKLKDEDMQTAIIQESTKISEVDHNTMPPIPVSSSSSPSLRPNAVVKTDAKTKIDDDAFGRRRSSSCSNSSLKQTQQSINLKLRRRWEEQKLTAYKKRHRSNESDDTELTSECKKPRIIKRIKIAINGNIATQRQISLGSSNNNSTDDDNDNEQQEDDENDDEECGESLNSAGSRNSQFEIENDNDEYNIAENHGSETEAIFVADDYDEIDEPEADDDDDADFEEDDEYYGGGDFHEVVTRDMSVTSTGNNHIVLTIKKTPSKTNSPSNSLSAMSPVIAATVAAAATVSTVGGGSNITIKLPAHTDLKIDALNQQRSDFNCKTKQMTATNFILNQADNRGVAADQAINLKPNEHVDFVEAPPQCSFKFSAEIPTLSSSSSLSVNNKTPLLQEEQYQMLRPARIVRKRKRRMRRKVKHLKPFKFADDTNNNENLSSYISTASTSKKLHQQLFFPHEICYWQNGIKEHILNISSCSSSCAEESEFEYYTSASDNDDNDAAAKSREKQEEEAVNIKQATSKMRSTNSRTSSSPIINCSNISEEHTPLPSPAPAYTTILPPTNGEKYKQKQETNNTFTYNEENANLQNDVNIDLNVKTEPSDELIPLTKEEKELPEENNSLLLSFNNIYRSADLYKEGIATAADDGADKLDDELAMTMNVGASGNGDVDVVEGCGGGDDYDTSAQQKIHRQIEEQLKQQLPNKNCDDYNNLYNNNNFNSIKFYSNKNSLENNDSCRLSYRHGSNSDEKSINMQTNKKTEKYVKSKFNTNTTTNNRPELIPHKEYRTGLRAVDEDVDDDDGNNCARIQQFKEWHQVLQLRSYNDELLTVLPYVVLE